MAHARTGRCRHCRRGRLGLGVCRGPRQDRQEGRAPRAGSGLGALRFHQLGFWGRRVHTPGASFILKEGIRSVRRINQAGELAAPRWMTRELPAPLAERLQDQERAIARSSCRSRTRPSAVLREVAQAIGVGDARPRRPGGRNASVIRCRRRRASATALSRWRPEQAGIRLVPAGGGMHSISFKGRPACVYDGRRHVGCPTGALANPLVTYLSDARKPAPSTSVERRHPRPHERQGRSRLGRRILRSAEGEARPARDRRRPRRLVGSEPAHPAQFGDRQALERARQFEHSRRQGHDDALQLGHVGDLRRGCSEPHGNDRRAGHVVRPLRQDEPQGCVRQHVHRGRVRIENERHRRLRQRASGSVRSRSAGVHETRGARAHQD